MRLVTSLRNASEQDRELICMTNERSRTISRERNNEIRAGHYGARALLNKLDIISCPAYNSSRALVTSGGSGVWVDAGPEEDNIGYGRMQGEGWAREPSGTVRHLTSPRALHRFAPPRRPFLITVPTWLKLDPPFAVCPGVDADNFAPEISRVNDALGNIVYIQESRRLIFLSRFLYDHYIFSPCAKNHF